MGVITLYLYSQALPLVELTPIRCIYCSRMLFKARAGVMAITNTGLPFQAIDPGINYYEHMCHSCKTTYRVLFQ